MRYSVACVHTSSALVAEPWGEVYMQTWQVQVFCSMHTHTSTSKKYGLHTVICTQSEKLATSLDAKPAIDHPTQTHNAIQPQPLLAWF